MNHGGEESGVRDEKVEASSTPRKENKTVHGRKRVLLGWKGGSEKTNGSERVKRGRRRGKKKRLK